MVIQEIPQQETSNSQPPSSGHIPCAPAAIAPAFQFASAFSGTNGFSPTSILIELFGWLASPDASAPALDGILLGLAGFETEQPNQSDAVLQHIRTAKSLQLNGAIEVPFIPAEHLNLSSFALLPSHPDGIRLTAYHCVHPFVTRQFYASGADTVRFTEC
jgi:hypothetical protein